jgi:hypothetical protein
MGLLKNVARPLKQGLDYFPHDTDALNDKKIQRLIGEYGLTGYGFYFALLEDIYSCLPTPYKWSENSEIFCRKCRISGAKSQRILNFCLETQLFYAQHFNIDSTLTSDGIITRGDEILRLRESKRKSYGRNNSRETTSKTTTETQEKLPDKPQTNSRETGESKVKDKLNSITNVIHTPLMLPSWINKEVWEAFLEMRKKKKKVPTEYAIQLIIKDLEAFKAAGDDPNKVLEKSIISGWPGVFSLKKENNLYPNKKDGGNHGINHGSNSRGLPVRYTTPEELEARENGGGQSA